MSELSKAYDEAIGALYSALVRIREYRGEREPGADWMNQPAHELGLDSLDTAEMLLELEIAMGIELTDEDLIASKDFASLAQHAVGKNGGR